MAFMINYICLQIVNFFVLFCTGAIVEIFNGTSFIAMRSIASKLVPSEELGIFFYILCTNAQRSFFRDLPWVVES